MRIAGSGRYSVIALAFTALFSGGSITWAQSAKTTTTEAKPAAKKEQPIKIAIQVSDNDPKSMNLALNNVKNALDFYKGQKKNVNIEIVTYGPGLHMLRSDTSPVKDRVGEMSLAYSNLTFSACRNTMANMQRQEGKDIPIVSEARITDSGVVRLVELQSQGYAYVRP